MVKAHMPKFKKWDDDVLKNIQQIVSRYRCNYYVNKKLEDIDEDDRPDEPIHKGDVKISEKTKRFHKKITLGWDTNEEFRTKIQNNGFILLEGVKRAADEIWKHKMPNKIFTKQERDYFDSVLRQVTSNQHNSVDFFLEKGIIRPQQCEKVACGRNMDIVFKKERLDGRSFQCPEHNRSRISIRHNSYLEEYKIPLSKIINGTWNWCARQRVDKSVQFAGVNRDTVIKINQHCRKVCSWKIDSLISHGPTLGGQDVLVQVDESLFNSKPKYNRGRRHGTQCWVFGIADTSITPATLICIPVEDRTADTH